MNQVQKLLFLLTLLASKASSQSIISRDWTGKIFIGNNLEYLAVINDSTLYSSINFYNDTAHFTLSNDTLRVKQHYFYTDKTGSGETVEYHEYKVAYSSDTLSLLNILIPNKKIIPSKKWITFINISKLKEPVLNFKYIKVKCSSVWVGEKSIIIDSTGQVIFLYKYFGNKLWTRIKGRLSNNEYLNFKNLLSNSLPSRLPLKRDCPIDAGTSDFSILIGNKLYQSNGCDLSWSHQFLFNYIYEIDKNAGFIKIK